MIGQYKERNAVRMSAAASFGWSVAWQPKKRLRGRLVLQSLEKKGDGNDGMSSGEESDLYRHLQETGDIYRSRYKVSCVTVLLRKLAHNAFHFQIILLSSSGH